MFSDVSEVLAAFITKVSPVAVPFPYWSGQPSALTDWFLYLKPISRTQATLKRRQTSARLHGATAQMTDIV
jgi:hypothetical protein